MKNIKVSIITVVYNGAEYLEQTIQSVINQTYSNIEYIIIDGGSTDGTLDIIKKYEDKIDYWISKKDNGIYDAMNKGLKEVSGEWVIFMNAGDEFYDESVLSDLFVDKKYDNDVGIIYGKTDIGHKILKYKKKILKEDFAKGMIICHQSAFYKRNSSIFYDERFKICGDQEFTIKYLEKYKALYVDRVISKYRLGGISSQAYKITLKEKIDINKKYNFSYFPIFLSFAQSLLVKLRDRFKGIK